MARKYIDEIITLKQVINYEISFFTNDLFPYGIIPYFNVDDVNNIYNFKKDTLFLILMIIKLNEKIL